MDQTISYLLGSMCFILVIIILYVINKINLESTNCEIIKKYSSNADPYISIFDESTGIIKPEFDVSLNKVFVKTAYNCCCTGNFKNDYVNFCALDNCNKQGVRALHFEIYSLNQKPIIATASIDKPKYIEMYNSLDFAKTMTRVYDTFMNKSDPLFLILEINSDIYQTYVGVYNALINVFGNNAVIFGTSDLKNTNLSQLRGKVCIIVSYKNSNNYITSKLNTITCQDITNDKKITYVQLLNTITDFNTTITFESDKIMYLKELYLLMPNKQDYTKNYDFISSGIRSGITFISMNFQFNDRHLKDYNKLFLSSPLSSSGFALKYYDDRVGSLYSPIINAIQKIPNLKTKISSSDDFIKLANVF